MCKYYQKHELQGKIMFKYGNIFQTYASISVPSLQIEITNVVHMLRV